MTICRYDNELPGSVIGNMREFDSCVAGSIPDLVTDGGCSLSGKASDCASKEQGSPESFRDRDSPKMVYRSMEGYYATNVEMKVRLFLNQQWLVAQWKMYPAFNRKVVGSSPTGPTNQCGDMEMWQSTMI